MKPIKSILFATDLSDKCKPAFDLASSMAIQYQATVILLHVTEKIPGYVETRLKGLFGDQEFQKIVEDHEKNVQGTLIAKKSSSSLIQTALETFCTQAGMDSSDCDIPREIAVVKGDVVEEIINQSEKHACGLIVLGGRKGFIRKTAIGSTIKEVLRRSKIPVLVVPPYT